MDVAVIGAGAAGLAAAWSLSGAGARVTLYDRGERPGGCLRTDDLDDARVDATAQLLGSYFSETFRLAEEVGASDLIVRSPGVDALWRKGRAHPLTYGSRASMLASGALPTGLKLKLGARYLPFLVHHHAALNANEPSRAAAGGLDQESIAAWGKREMGSDFVEYMAYPLLAAYYGATPETTSAGFYHALAHAGLDVAVYAVKGGVGELAEAVLRAIEARGGSFEPGVTIDAVVEVDAGVEVRSGHERHRYDAAVVAVPPAAAARMTSLPESMAEWLRGVRANPALSLAVLIEGKLPGSYFGLSFPRTEPPGDRLVAVCIESRKAPGLVPAGTELLVVYPAPEMARRLIAAEPRQVLETLLPGLEQVFHGIGGRVRRARVYRHPDGVGEFYPGYLQHLASFDPARLPARIQLAGSFLVAPTVEGAVRSGRESARRLIERIGAA